MYFSRMTPAILAGVICLPVIIFNFLQQPFPLYCSFLVGFLKEPPFFEDKHFFDTKPLGVIL